MFMKTKFILGVLTVNGIIADAQLSLTQQVSSTLSPRDTLNPVLLRAEAGREFSDSVFATSSGGNACSAY